MNKQDILRLLDDGERVRLECKKAQNSVPNSLWNTYSARNPRIQNMLCMIGYGENIGSGFPTIIEAWKAAGWDKPELKNKIELDEVELMLPIPNTKEVNNTKDDTKEMSDVVKDVVKELSERQRNMLRLIKDNPTLSANEMSQKMGIVSRTIQRDLATLHEKGFIAREGGRKEGKWVILKNI